MMHARIAIIGMSNPYSANPRRALWPEPANSAGGRLWKMLNARTGATHADYAQAFHRYNLCPMHWEVDEARVSWCSMEPDLIENFDRILLLGAAVRRAARFPHSDPVYVSDTICAIPHPSGLNLWYNSPTNRGIVEVLLEELYTQAIGGYTPSHADVPSVPELSPERPRP